MFTFVIIWCCDAWNSFDLSFEETKNCKINCKKIFSLNFEKIAKHDPADNVNIVVGPYFPF